MDLKSDINSQEFIPKSKPPNNNNNDENTTSDIHSINKIFSNANSIIGLNVSKLYTFKLIYIFQDEHQFLENLNIDDIFPPNDTFYISPNSNLGDSNFFSFCGDKSSVFKNLNEKDCDDDNKSNFTFDSELEKQVGLLTEEEEDDDLNEAKLNLENEDSNWSSISVLKLSNNQHNMTTPANKIIYNMESEDKSSINTNITQNNTLKNIPSSSIFNCMKSNKTNNNFNSNFDIKKFSSSSIYNNKTQDNPYFSNNQTNSINNLTNMTNRTNMNGKCGIWNLKNGVNINLNNRQFNNRFYGINQSYDFHYNSLGIHNLKYFNNQNKINNNNNTSNK